MINLSKLCCKQLLIALSYFCLAMLGLSLSTSHSIGATFYPAAGFALGVLIVFGFRKIMGVFLGALITTSWLKTEGAIPEIEQLPIILLMSAVITLQALLAYFLLRKYADLEGSFVKERGPLFARFFLATFITTLIGSLASISCFVLDGYFDWQSAFPFWLRWWAGDMLGIVVMAPLTLVLLAPFSDRNSIVKRAGIPLIIAFFLIAFLTHKVDQDQTKQTQQFVDQTLKQYQSELENYLTRIEEKVSALARFYESSLHISLQEFAQFSKVQSNTEDFINGYSWNRLLAPDEVPEFENQIAEELTLPGFKLRELPNTWLVGERPEWRVVVERIYPLNQMNKVVGLDISSDRVRGQTLQTAIQSKKMRVTPPIQLVQSNGENEKSILIISPVFGGDYPANKASSELPKGFAVGVVNLSNLLKHTFKQEYSTQLKITLLDLGDEIIEIYQKEAHSQLPHISLKQSSQFSFVDRHWQLSIEPSEALSNEISSDYDLWFSLFALCVSAAFVYFLFVNALNQANIEKEIYDKTEILALVRKIQSTYIQKDDFDTMLAKLLFRLADFIQAESVILATKSKVDKLDIEFIGFQSKGKNAPQLKLLEYTVQNTSGHMISFHKVNLRPLIGSTHRSVLFIPWSDNERIRVIAASVDSKRIDPELLSKLELVRDSLEGTSRAINDRNKSIQVMHELKENSALLSQAETIGNAGTWKISHQSKKHQFSPNVFKMFGISESQIAHPLRIFNELIHPEDKLELKARFLTSLNHGMGVFETEHRIFLKDTHEIRYVKERFEHIYGAGGELVTTNGIIYDVTDMHKEANRLELEAKRVQQQRESITQLTFGMLSAPSGLDTKLEAIVNQASTVLKVSRVGIWLFSEDRAALNCVAMIKNSQMIKAPTLSLVSKDYPVYFKSLRESARINVENTEDDARVCELYDSYLKPNNIQSMLDVSITRDGEIIGILCLEHVGATRYWQADESLFANTLAALAGQTIDAQERSGYLDKLVQQKKDREKILDSMVDAVITINEKGIILTANKATQKQFGYTYEELVGHSVNKLMPEDVAAQHNHYLKNYTSGGPAKIIGIGRVLKGKKKSNELFPMRLSVSELSETEGNSRVFVGTLHDLTAEQKQQEQMQRSEKMDALGQLTGGIAHDFNNILGVMLGYSEMLLEFLPEDQTRLIGYAKQIEVAGERARTLIQKLRAFSKKDTGVNKQVDLNKLIQDQKLMLEKAITSKNHLRLNLTGKIQTICIDESDFENGLLNMCVNAMHAMPDGGEITITTRNEWLEANHANTLGVIPGEYVSLSVKDTGKGMPGHVLERIFEPFFSTKGEKGTGLGLSQLYGFVKRSLGAITVESELGKGTEFTLYFPVKTDKVEVVEQQVLVNSDLSARHNETVLVVDDEPQLKQVLAEKLESKGYQVLMAEDGEKALDILRNQTVAMVLSDIVMPNMDGVAMANIIEKEFPDIKIQLMSGFSDKLQSSLNNQTLYEQRLIKPFSLDELLLRIKMNLEKEAKVH